jgi:hypothetical protein
MALGDLLKRITASQQSLTVDRLKAYRQLIREIANEREPDANKVAMILSEAGKSVEVLAQDVEAFQRRMELSQEANSLPQIERKLTAVQKKIDTAVKAFAKIEEQHEQEIGPLEDELKRLQDARRSGEQARAALVQTVTDEELLAKKTELDRALTMKQNEIREARNLLQIREQRLLEVQRNETKWGKTQVNELTTKWTRRIAESHKMLPQLQSELEAIQAEQAKFIERLIDP